VVRKNYFRKVTGHTEKISDIRLEL
jgi:hypothetical protein